MKYSSKRSSSLFLMELILALFFFMIVSVCCTRMFVKAWVTSRKASELNQAQNCAGNIAEVLNSDQDSEQALMRMFPEMIREEEKYLLYYNEEWQVCDQEKACYRIEVLIDLKENNQSGSITIKDKKETTIYQLDMIKHIPYHVERKE